MCCSEVKKPLTFEEQVNHLESDLGLIIGDRNFALNVLSRVNYYRLIDAYSLGLYTDNTKSEFLEGVTFFQIYDLYLFDEELRHIVSELIEDFEIQFRTALAYRLGINHGALSYLNRNIFCGEKYFNEFINSYEREKINQKKSLIVKHHNAKYGEKMPIWAVVEILSFGTVSKLYKNMQNYDCAQISKLFHTDTIYLNSWLRAFVETRNICAHYGRLYNRRLTSPPKLYKNQKKIIHNSNRIFAVIYILKRFIESDKWVSSTIRLKASITRHNSVDLSCMGFPNNWEELLELDTVSKVKKETMKRNSP